MPPEFSLLAYPSTHTRRLVRLVQEGVVEGRAVFACWLICCEWLPWWPLMSRAQWAVSAMAWDCQHCSNHFNACSPQNLMYKLIKDYNQLISSISVNVCSIAFKKVLLQITLNDIFEYTISFLCTRKWNDFGMIESNTRHQLIKHKFSFKMVYTCKMNVIVHICFVTFWITWQTLIGIMCSRPRFC